MKQRPCQLLMEQGPCQLVMEQGSCHRTETVPVTDGTGTVPAVRLGTRPAEAGTGTMPAAALEQGPCQCQITDTDLMVYRHVGVLGGMNFDTVRLLDLPDGNELGVVSSCSGTRQCA